MSKSILVVEDDPDTQIGLKLRLEFGDYEVHIAPDAVNAISLARQKKPDLILLDLGLPAGDGFLVMERLKNFTDLSMIPIVVLTARTGAGTRERAVREGAAAYFTKPVDNAELLTAIDSLMGRDRVGV